MRLIFLSFILGSVLLLIFFSLTATFVNVVDFTFCLLNDLREPGLKRGEICNDITKCIGLEKGGEYGD